MARLPYYGKSRKKGYKHKAKITELPHIQDYSSSKSGNSIENCYPKHWVTCFFLWVWHLPRVITSFMSKFTIEKNASKTNQKRANSGVESRISLLERNLCECIEKIKSLESKIELLTEGQGDQRIESTNYSSEQRNSRTVNLNGKASKIPSAVAPVPPPLPAPPLPPPLPPPPPPALPPVLNQVSNKNISSLKLANNGNKPRPAPMTPRPLISLDDIAKVKLKKTPYVPKKEKNGANVRISLEALRSVKLRKTNYENSRTSPSKGKSPTFKVNARLSRCALIDASPRAASAKNISNLIGEDLTPIITCALKKRFDALNFSFEEDKENLEPFFS